MTTTNPHASRSLASLTDRLRSDPDAFKPMSDDDLIREASYPAIMEILRMRDEVERLTAEVDALRGIQNPPSTIEQSICQNPKCGRNFTPRKQGQMTCSKSCGAVVSNERRYPGAGERHRRIIELSESGMSEVKIAREIGLHASYVGSIIRAKRGTP